MKPSLTRAVVFDIGMVLLRFDFELALRKLKDRCPAKHEELTFLLWGSGLVEAYDLGKINTKAFAQQVSRLIGFQGTSQELIEVWSNIFTPNLPMMARAYRWKAQGMSLYLLSNTCEAHVEFFTTRYDVFQIFDGEIYSYREGVAKPERAIFEKLLQRYHLDPQTTTFMDDRLENVLTARELGISAIQYIDEYDLAKKLEALGLD